MKYNNTELSDIICTKISHDLIGSIGALSASLELISENNNILDDDTANILTMAAHALSARQKMFRLAFGQDTKSMEITEVENICRDYLTTIGNPSNPLVFTLNNASAKLAKIICLCTLIGAEICIKGGTITVNITADSLSLSINSEHNLYSAKIANYQKIVNNQKIEDNSPQYAALIYLKEFLGEDVCIKISSDDNTMEMIIK